MIGSSSHARLSQVTSPRIMSPTLPPELRYVTFSSVDTPVENNPRDARAREPPRSTMDAMVPPWRMPRRFVCSFSIESSKLTFPGEAAVIRSLMSLLERRLTVAGCRPPWESSEAQGLEGKTLRYSPHPVGCGRIPKLALFGKPNVN
jgi:hypothetical protein